LTIFRHLLLSLSHLEPGCRHTIGLFLIFVTVFC